jgi:hypothetical protein
MRFVFLALLGLLSFWSPQPAQAQTPVAMYCYQGPTNPQWSPCSASNQLQVSASVTASVTGFAPNGNYASITSAGTSGSVALPAGAVVVFSNTGTTTVSCTLGVGSATAVAGEIQIPASSSVAFTVGSNTFGACIDQTGSTSNTVVLAGGTGLFTGFGGGGGGSGGSVTQGTSPWVDNITQFGGTNISTGTGTGGAGIPRVTVSSDSFPATQPVSLTSTTLSAPISDRTVAPTAITTAGTSTLTINSQGASVVQWTFSSFTTGTITFQLADATGSAFNNTQCFPGSSPYALVGSVTTTNGSWFCPTGGAAQARIVMTGGGGTATVSANAGAGVNNLANISAEQSAIPAGTATIGNVNGAPNVTPTNCGGTVVTGGTAVNAFTAGATKHGFTIANIDTTEVLWISFTTTALASDTQSYPLAAATATTFAGLSSFTSPVGFGLNTALSVVAATNGHKFSCTWW